MLALHVFAPLKLSLSFAPVAKKWLKANTLIPSDDVLIILGSFSFCTDSWNVFITPSIKPLWSIQGSGC